MREFGLDRFQRLEQSREARDLLLADFRAVNHPRRVTRYHPRRGTAVQSGLMASLALLGAACSPSAADKQSSPDQASKNPGASQPNKGPKFPFSGTWYLTAGPHTDGYAQNGELYALDFAPKPVIACPGGPTPTEYFVEASASGKVTVVGNPNDRTDPHHSVVKIEHPDGSVLGYMHLDNIKVTKGQEVQQGEPLGNPSCEISPGGKTTGVHVHQFLEKLGKGRSVIGAIISGWKVEEDGRLTKAGEIARQGNTARCDTAQSCGGVRNDLMNDSQTLITNSKEGVTPIPPVPGITPTIAVPMLNPTETPKPAEQAPRIGYIRHLSTKSPYRVDRLSDWKVSSGSNAQNNTDVFFSSIDRNSIPQFSVITVPVKSFVTSESFAQECQAIADSRQSFGFKESRFDKLPSPTLIERQISGKKAYEVKYLSDVIGNKNNPIQVTHICFVDGGLSWDVGFMQYYLVDANKFQQDSEIYNNMVNTFKLNSSK